MNYEFQHIENFSDIANALNGNKHFTVTKKDGFIFVNYIIASPDTFPPITDNRSIFYREFRGLTFYEDIGRIAARKYHKFFNLGERSETELKKVNFNAPHIVLEKLDGSMITPVWYKNDIILHTKMGDTDVAKQATDFMNKNPRYRQFMIVSTMNGFTPIFEWCSRKNRIVLDYPNDRLVLTAVREMTTGRYIDYNIMEKVAIRNHIDCVNKIEGTTEEIIDYIRKHDEMEGVVIRFENGHMIKVKSEWYSLIHKTKEKIAFEKDVWRLIIEDKLDDLVPFLPLEEEQNLRVFQKDIQQYVEYWTNKLETSFKQNIKEIDPVKYISFFDNEETFDKSKKKAFALLIKEEFFGTMTILRSLMFRKYDNPDLLFSDLFKEMCLNNLTTSSKLENIRPLFEDIRWNERED